MSPEWPSETRSCCLPVLRQEELSPELPAVPRCPLLAPEFLGTAGPPEELWWVRVGCGCGQPLVMPPLAAGHPDSPLLTWAPSGEPFLALWYALCWGTRPLSLEPLGRPALAPAWSGQPLVSSTGCGSSPGCCVASPPSSREQGCLGGQARRQLRVGHPRPDRCCRRGGRRSPPWPCSPTWTESVKARPHLGGPPLAPHVDFEGSASPPRGCTADHHEALLPALLGPHRLGGV